MTPFSTKYLSQTALQHLIKYETIESFTPSRDNNYELKLYKHNFKCNYFILIISGNGEVIVGKENFKYTAHAYSYFGLQAIIGEAETKKDLLSEQCNKELNYLPDYSMTVREKCTFLRLTRQTYLKFVKNDRNVVDLKPVNELLKSNVKRLSLKKTDSKKSLKKNWSVGNFQV